MINPANITITNVIPFRIVGVYNNAGTWTQASGSNFATAGIASAPWVVCDLNTKR